MTRYRTVIAFLALGVACGALADERSMPIHGRHVAMPAAEAPRAAPVTPAPRHGPVKGSELLLGKPLASEAEPGPALSTEASLAPGTGFDAISQATSGVDTPDVNLAVGPGVASNPGGYLVETVNRGLRIFRKDGSAASAYLPFDGGPGALFSSQQLKTFDPRLVYDPYAQRFFVIAIDNNDTTNPALRQSWIWVAMSVSSDPTLGWVTFQTAGPAASWIDFPSLGYDREALYIGVNVFGALDNLGDPPGSLLYRAIGKASMLGSSPQITQLVDRIEPTGGFKHWAMRAAEQQGLAAGQAATGLFIGSVQAPMGTNITRLRLVKMRQPLDPVQAQLLSFDLTVPAYRVPSVDAPQKVPTCSHPTGTALDVLSGQLLNAVWRDGDLYTAHAVWGPVPPLASRNVARWYQVRTGPPPAPVAWAQLVQSGTLDNEVGASDHAFAPAIYVNPQGSVALVFTRASSQTFAGLWATGRAACDPPGVMAPPVELRAGLSCYYSQAAPHRWGDYFGLGLDPSSPTVFWAGGEFAASANKWGTHLRELAIGESCFECLCGLED